MLSRFLAATVIAALVYCLPGSAIAEPLPIELVRQPQVMAGIDAFPRLAGGQRGAEAINPALARADARITKAARDCMSGKSSFKPYWKRKITVTMSGPRYLAYVARDDYFCFLRRSAVQVPDGGHHRS